MKDKKNTYDDWGMFIDNLRYSKNKDYKDCGHSVTYVCNCNEMDDPNDFFEELDFSEPYPTKKTDRRLLLTKRR